MNDLPIIISNDCVAGFIYKCKLNCRQYPHHLLYHYFNTESFSKLINYFDTIDFSSYKIKYRDDIDEINYYGVHCTIPIMVFNNDILRYMFHNIIKCDENVYLNNKKIENQYKIKLNKFKTNKNIPIFILNERKSFLFSNDFDELNISKFFSKSYKYKILFITYNPIYKKYESDNIKVMVKDINLELPIDLKDSAYEELKKLKWI